MTFGNIWVLYFLFGVVIWGLWEWRRSSRKIAIILKVLAFGSIVTALAEPKLEFLESKISVAVLADISSSIPDTQIQQQREIVDHLKKNRNKNQLLVFSFDGTVRRGFLSRDNSLVGTNFEVALKAGLAALPANSSSKILLISDGWENQGAVERAVIPARRRGVPVSTLVLQGRTRSGLQLNSISAPSRVFMGESFAVDVSIDSPSETSADVFLSAEEKEIGKIRTNLSVGNNVVKIYARLDVEGAVLLKGRIVSERFGELAFQHAVSLMEPKILFLSGDRQEEDVHLLAGLRASGFQVERSMGILPGDLNDFQAIIANNIDLENLQTKSKERIENFIGEGGGFLQIAGGNSLYADDVENKKDPLRKALPANPAPPRTPEGTAVVLILDKSSSMEGQKMDLARQSALGVVDNLRPIDQVGVLVFDNSFEWATELQKNERPNSTKDLISGIVADGGTQIAPALAEAFEKIKTTKAVYKHILLLTDGISEEGNSIELAEEAAKLKVTISTIGLGQDVNRAYLERVARTAEGKPHFLINISGLTQLVLKDVMEHTGSSVIEKEALSRVVEQAEILHETHIEEAGPLFGWVKFTAKPEAEIILEVNSSDSEKDPLLVRWQYKLGKASVFTSDAKQVWAANWVDWAGFDIFWTNIVRDLLPRIHPVETKSFLDSAEKKIVIRYTRNEIAAKKNIGQLPELYVLGPDNFRYVASIESISTGLYEARVPVQDQEGLFRIRPSSRLDLFPETTFYRHDVEAEQYGSNPDLLRKLANWTGGQFNPTPENVFRLEQPQIASMNLWPGFLVSALFFTLLELMFRKGWIPLLRSFQ